MASGFPWNSWDLRYLPNRRFTQPDSRFPLPDSRFWTGIYNQSSTIRSDMAVKVADVFIHPTDLWQGIRSILNFSRQSVYYAFQLLYENTIEEQDIKTYLLTMCIPWDLWAEIMQVVTACRGYLSENNNTIQSEGPFEHWFGLLRAFIAHIEKDASRLELGKNLREKFLSTPNWEEVAS